MKFRVEREVLADAVTWVARGLPARPPVPVLAGVLIEADDEGTLTLSAFDYEVSAKVTVAGRGRRGRHRPGAGSAARRHLAQPAVQAGRRRHRGQQGRGHLRLVAVQPDADAGRRLPDPADLPEPPAAPSRATSSPRRSPRSPSPPTAATPCRSSPASGSRSTGDKITLLATDRYRLAMRELTWNPEATDASHLALVPARTLSETAKALGASGSIEVALGLVGRRRRAGRLRGRPATHDDPAARRRVPQGHLDLPHQRRHRGRRSGPAELIEAVKRVALVAERNTPVRLKFTDGQVAIEAGTGDDAQASEAVESTLTGPEIEIAFNPQFLLDGLGAVGTDYSRLSFTQPSRPAVLSGQAELDGEADTSYRYVLMPVRFAS